MKIDNRVARILVMSSLTCFALAVSFGCSSKTEEVPTPDPNATPAVAPAPGGATPASTKVPDQDFKEGKS